MVALVMLGSVLVLAPASLTALGAHRRGSGAVVAVLVGAFFPVTWTVWYLRDERPYRRAA